MILISYVKRVSICGLVFQK